MKDTTFSLANSHDTCANIVAPFEKIDVLIGWLRMLKGDMSPEQFIALVVEVWPEAGPNAVIAVQTCAELIGLGS